MHADDVLDIGGDRDVAEEVGALQALLEIVEEAAHLGRVESRAVHEARDRVAEQAVGGEHHVHADVDRMMAARARPRALADRVEQLAEGADVLAGDLGDGEGDGGLRHAGEVERVVELGHGDAAEADVGRLEDPRQAPRRRVELVGVGAQPSGHQVDARAARDGEGVAAEVAGRGPLRGPGEARIAAAQKAEAAADVHVRDVRVAELREAGGIRRERPAEGHVHRAAEHLGEALLDVVELVLPGVGQRIGLLEEGRRLVGEGIADEERIEPRIAGGDAVEARGDRADHAARAAFAAEELARIQGIALDDEVVAEPAAVDGGVVVHIAHRQRSRRPNIRQLQQRDGHERHLGGLHAGPPV